MIYNFETAYYDSMRSRLSGFNPKDRMAHAALTAAGAAARPCQASTVPQSIPARLAGTRRHDQFAALAGHGFLDMHKMSVSIFFADADGLGDIQRGHGTLQQQLDDLLSNGWHGIQDDCCPIWR
jgi:hypothetical protein